MLAAVDLGSNSFRMHIARHEGDAIRVVKSAREPIRLAAGLDENGNLTAEAMQSAIDCLSRFREILNAYPVENLRVVATNTIRIAKMPLFFYRKQKQQLGTLLTLFRARKKAA